MLSGIDVSHHQDPRVLDYRALSERCAFVWVRATYGTRSDSSMHSHIKRARDNGLTVGLYHFFRQGQDVKEQTEAFIDRCCSVCVGEGWLPPCIDLEANERWDGLVDPDQYDQAQEIAGELFRRFGSFTIYSTRSFYDALGRPKWWQAGLLWVAHWEVKQPRTPGNRPWDFWQHRVSKIPEYPRGPIDQNYSYGDMLPTLKPRRASLLPMSVDWDEYNKARSKIVLDSD